MRTSAVQKWTKENSLGENLRGAGQTGESTIGIETSKGEQGKNCINRRMGNRDV